MCLEVESDYQKSSAWLKSIFREVYVQGHETDLGSWEFQDTPKIFGDLPGKACSPGKF